MVPRLPDHWQFPLAAAIACVVSGAFIEACAPFSPLAGRRAASASTLSAFAVRYASLATETSMLLALTVVGGLVLLSRRLRTPEQRLRVALQVTTIGFLAALLIAVVGFMGLFVLPIAAGAV